MSGAAGNRRIQNIGVQLHTVRAGMKSDVEQTIATVAALGYTEVEFAGYFGQSPDKLRSIIERHGLTAPAAHVNYDVLGEKWPTVLEAAQIIGHKYIVISGIDEHVRNQPDGWKRVAETFNRAGEVSKKTGIQLAYHNHSIEFVAVDGHLPYDVLLDNCSSDLVKMELDICWIVFGGQDPLTYFNRYPGCFPLLHVKDLKNIPSQTLLDHAAASHERIDAEMTEVGSGAIDWKRIFDQSGKAGIMHYFVEHDRPASPFDSIKTSYEYLKALRF